MSRRRLEQSSGHKSRITKSHSVPLMGKDSAYTDFLLDLQRAARLNGNAPIQEQGLQDSETGEGKKLSKMVCTQMNYPVTSSMNETLNIDVTLQRETEPFVFTVQENTDANFINSSLVIGKTLWLCLHNIIV